MRTAQPESVAVNYSPSFHLLSPEVGKVTSDGY